MWRRESGSAVASYERCARGQGWKIDGWVREELRGRRGAHTPGGTEAGLVIRASSRGR
ncbi:MAG: hypothetical protein N2595_00850 [bacterium]|nr:hypothetical protein [bacterium]